MSIQHVAIIMDGNGRWAKQRNLSRAKGHQAGAKAVRKIITKSREISLPYLTLYALSRENLKRPKEELINLFNMLVEFVTKELQNLIDNDICLHVVGDISSLPIATQKAIKYAITKTSACKTTNLCLALAYSAKEEIMRAFIRMNKEKNHLGLEFSSFDEIGKMLEHFPHYLDAPSFPDADLIIRTGGETRLSNFLLYQSAYSELYFSSLFFPDFDENEFQNALDDFYSRTRRYGKTDEQLDLNKNT